MWIIPFSNFKSENIIPLLSPPPPPPPSPFSPSRDPDLPVLAQGHPTLGAGVGNVLEVVQTSGDASQAPAAEEISRHVAFSSTLARTGQQMRLTTSWCTWMTWDMPPGRESSWSQCESAGCSWGIAHPVYRDMYSLQQKHCTTTLDEKSSVFLTVNFYEILHASTYTMYTYISKVKKSPRMATLNYSHFGNPSRSYQRAHYTVQ